MRNLLDMERDFFSGTNRVNFNRINGLLTNLSDSKKAKFDTTVKLSKEVYKSFTWFNSESGKEEMRIAGISMNAEQFGNKIFGWKKSYFYKMVKLGTVAEEQRGLITRFKTECTRLESQGENVSRSLENMLKYANDSASSTDESGEETEVRTRPNVLLEVKMGDKKAKISGDTQEWTFNTNMNLADVEEFIVYATRLKDHLITEHNRGLIAESIVESATERIMENSIDSA